MQKRALRTLKDQELCQWRREQSMKQLEGSSPISSVRNSGIEEQTTNTPGSRGKEGFKRGREQIMKLDAVRTSPSRSRCGQRALQTCYHSN